ncbi:MAG: homocitrate synthase/isopropylmalate synthase family protein [Bdellovibrionota bacterium]|jgi:2-isopropylmalate synthase
MDESRRVIIFDTTLRDGQQCPGAGMDFEHNLQYARVAANCGIDVIEAGFPSASSLDYKIVTAVVDEICHEEDSPIVAALCQMREHQVETTIRSLEKAAAVKKGRMHIYLPVDPELMAASLGGHGINKEALLDDLAKFCKQAVAAGLEVEYSPEGYSRMGDNFDFVTDSIRAAVSAGATVINCPDTIGGAYRAQGEEYFVEKMIRHAQIIRSEFPDKEITWSTHCHNDYGLAVDNTLNAVFHGPARQIEGCFNGIGERAGNAALEQCIMIIKHFGGCFDKDNPFFTTVKTEHIKGISDFVSRNMLPRQAHWPICGDNAAKHSSGGHTNAVLKNPLAYQPYDPHEIGQEISLIFGPLSGGNHAKSIIENNGYLCSDSEKSEIAQFIKDTYQERRKGVTDNELMKAYFKYRAPIHISSFDYSKTQNRSEICLTGKFFDESGTIKESMEGKSSALAVLKHLIDRKFPNTTIDSYSSESVGTSIHALSLSTIVLIADGRRFQAQGEDQDIEISAMKALINVVNHAYIEMNFRR